MITKFERRLLKNHWGENLPFNYDHIVKVYEENRKWVIIRMILLICWVGLTRFAFENSTGYYIGGRPMDVSYEALMDLLFAFIFTLNLCFCAILSMLGICGIFNFESIFESNSYL